MRILFPGLVTLLLISCNKCEFTGNLGLLEGNWTWDYTLYGCETTYPGFNCGFSRPACEEYVLEFNGDGQLIISKNSKVETKHCIEDVSFVSVGVYVAYSVQFEDIDRVIPIYASGDSLITSEFPINSFEGELTFGPHINILKRE